MYRFAISPTGDMHVDDLRFALFNYICAKQEGKHFVLMIDDTDKKQNVENGDIGIINILKLFGFEFDSIQYASENLKFYHQFASKLLENKKAFCCFCSNITDEKNAFYDGTCKHLSDDEVIGNENPFCIRIKSPKKAVTLQDTINGKLEFEADDIDDFIVLKEDKYPTHCFAFGVNDMLYNVLHVIISKEHLKDSAKELHVRNALGYEACVRYTHLAPIKNLKNIPSVVNLLENGYLPEAILSYLLSLGNDIEKGIFDMDEAKENFKLEDISNLHVNFNKDELKSVNKEHIRALDNKKLSAMIGYSSGYVGELAKLYTKEASTLNELKIKIDNIFSKKVFKGKYKNECEFLATSILNAPCFEEFDDFKEYLLGKTMLNDDQFSKVLEMVFINEKSEVKIEDIYKIMKNHLKEIVKW